MKKKISIVYNLIWSVKELALFNKSYLAVLIIESAVKGVTPVIGLLLIKRIIDYVQYRQESVREAIYLLIILTSVQLISELILILSRVKLDQYELQFDVFFQEKIYTQATALDCKQFENSRTYDLINRTQYDANAGIIGGIKTVFSLVSFAISTASYITIIMSFNVLIFFVVILFPVVRYMFEKKYNLEEYAITKNNTEKDRRAFYYGHLLTESEAFKELKIFGLSRLFINRYSEIKNRCNGDVIKLNVARGKVFACLVTIERVIDCIVTLFILAMTFDGILSIGSFVLYNNSIDGLKNNMSSVFSQVSFLYKNSAMIDEIRLFFNLQPENTNKDGIIIEKIDSIKMENVSYRYGSSKEYILKNINLEIGRGELIIFMGSNGSGKTTLMKIIMGLYDDYMGDVYINNHNLRDLNIEEYRTHVSALFQNYIRFESTIGENVGYGNTSEINNALELKRILNKVKMEEFTDSLSSELGYQFHNGTQISLGQWQKLAVGRTLFRNADLYVFDEPNSSLDMITESVILHAIQEETKDRISLIVMHRFNYMIEQADRIIVLHDGEISELGTHEELLLQDGLYKDLFHAYKEISFSLTA